MLLRRYTRLFAIYTVRVSNEDILSSTAFRKTYPSGRSALLPCPVQSTSYITRREDACPCLYIANSQAYKPFGRVT